MKKSCIVPCILGIAAIAIGYQVGKRYYYQSLGHGKTCCCKKG